MCKSLNCVRHSWMNGSLIDTIWSSKRITKRITKPQKSCLLPVLFSVLCQDIMTADSLSQGLNQPPSGQLKTRSTTWAAALVQNLTIVTGTFSVFFVKNDKYYCTLLRSCDLLSVRKCISMSPLYYPPGGRSIVSTSRTIPIELKRKKC